ncbi:hypothetical protein C8R46DRAFT_1226503 [Mycena filopes]|nr:hypothetical protein C8R46DRAFT_1226503 [Mycena filopes]
MDTKASSGPATSDPLKQPLMLPLSVQAAHTNADAADLGPFRRLLLGATMLFLGLVHAAVITMCAHAILTLASPNRYLPTLRWSPAIGAVGLIHSVSLVSLILLAVSFVLRPTNPEKSLYWVIPFIFQTATPWYAMCFQYPFGTLLGVYAISSPSLFGADTGLHYTEAFNIGITAGVVHFFLHLAQATEYDRLLWPVWFSNFCVEQSKGTAITLCGHAAFHIAAPHLAEYATRSSGASRVGAFGAFIKVLLVHAYRYYGDQEPGSRETEEIRYTDCSNVLSSAASNTFLGACSGLIWFGVIGGLLSMPFEGLDILPAMGVGLVGGALMGLCGIRFVFE